MEIHSDGYKADYHLFDCLNQNKLTLGVAVEELSNWVEQRGSVDIAGNVRWALETLDENLVFIREGIADLNVGGSLRDH